MLTRIFLIILAIIGISNLTHPDRVYAQSEDLNTRQVPENRPQMQLSFSPVVKQVSPAIVNIYTKRTVSTRAVSPFFHDPFFAPFFRDDFFGGRMRQRVESSLGSGVIIDQDGLVVTNAHVIRGAEKITVVLNDGREFAATLALSDAPSDLALLRIKTEGEVLPHASLKPSESLEVGDLVLAIGNPFGVGQTVTSGIVSALARSTLNINDFNFFIQTDAAINPGNSGGALVALDGGVVGINTAIYSRDGGSLGIGFAIPSEMVASVVASEKQGRSGDSGVVRPWLGVSAQDVTSDIARSLGLEKPWGLLIAELHPVSPLGRAGLKVGDVVQAMNGREIRSAAEMKFRMATVPIGETAEVSIIRNNKTYQFTVQAMEPPDEPPRNETALSGSHPLNGAVIAHINPAVAVELGLEEETGVVVTDVQRGSNASRFFAPGTVLLEINGREIENVADAQRALKGSSQRGWAFLVKAQGRIQRLILG